MAVPVSFCKQDQQHRRADEREQDKLVPHVIHAEADGTNGFCDYQGRCKLGEFGRLYAERANPQPCLVSPYFLADNGNQ